MRGRTLDTPRIKVLLFDIDGTLLSCGSQVGAIYLAALRDVFGELGERAARLGAGYSFAGRTDPRIAVDLLAGAGLAESEALAGLSRLRERYLARLGEAFDPRKVRAMPGVVALLERLSARRDLALGLLTGNWLGGARTKLRALGMERFFRFGAYGDDGVDRHELPPVALARAGAVCGLPIAPEEALVIGDTLEDVRCARRHGLRVLAVATGRIGIEELRGGAPDWVLPTLESLPADLLPEPLDAGRSAVVVP